MIRKLIYAISEADFKRTSEVKLFKEFKGGIYFPQEIEAIGLSGGKKTHATTSKITEIQINGELPDNVFQLSFPYDTLMIDGVTKTSYKIDQNGSQISEPTPLDRVVPPISDKTAGKPSPYQTDREPTSIIDWIFPVFLIVFLIGIMIKLFYKIKGNKKS